MKKVKIACVGDSITEGWGIEDVADYYPSILQDLLGSSYEVANFGHSGATATRDFQWSGEDFCRDYTLSPKYFPSLEFEADILIFSLGMNDRINCETEVGMEKFISDYLELIDSYRHPKLKQMYLWSGITPTAPDVELVEEINGALLKVLEHSKARAIDLSSLSYSPEKFIDSIHPNSIGMREIAELTAQHFEEALKPA